MRVSSFEAFQKILRIQILPARARNSGEKKWDHLIYMWGCRFPDFKGGGLVVTANKWNMP